MRCLTCLLSNYLARALVFPDSEKHRLTKAVIARPLRAFRVLLIKSREA